MKNNKTFPDHRRIYTEREVIEAVMAVRENADELAYESDDVLSMKIGAAHVLGHLPDK